MNIRKATKICFERYINFDLDEDTLNLCKKGIEEIDKLPIDKLSRWLGYIQGVAVRSGLTTVDEERNFTRPFFHEAYKNENIEIPESIDVRKR